MNPGDRRAAAVLVAAGSGERLGATLPKAFVDLAGVPLLLRAARALVASGAVGDLVVVVGAGHQERARDLLERDGVALRAACEGGQTRQESVTRGLAALCADDHVVAVHDAARPLAPPDLIARVVEAVRPPVVAAAPGLPVVDTLKAVDGGAVRTVDRTGLWAVQTPQVFDRATLARAHQDAVGAVTDDLALIEAAGGQIVLVPGDRRNFKITYPEDLLFAEALVRAGA